MKKYKIVAPEPYHWKSISRLISMSIPNAIISHLGVRFGSIYYQNTSQNTDTCCFIALDNSQKVIGVILGSMDSEHAKKISNALKVKLLIAANIRLLSPAFLKWILKGFVYKLIKRNEKNPLAREFSFSVSIM